MVVIGEAGSGFVVGFGWWLGFQIFNFIVGGDCGFNLIFEVFFFFLVGGGCYCGFGLVVLVVVVVGDGDGDGGSDCCGCGWWWPVVVGVGVICWVEMEVCELIG